MIPFNQAASVPRVARNELELGRIIGQGSFGVVLEILAPRTSNASRTLNWECMKKENDDDVASFVMKAIPDDCHKDGQLSSRALRDMIKEAQFLSVLSHPNILSLRGVSVDMDAESSKDCFLILDCLCETLDQRLNRWRVEKTIRTKCFVMKMKKSFSKGKKDSGREERLLIACDVLRALAYLHQNGIMHRDVNPRNIGFDRLNETKLFDFGSAKQLNSEREHDARNHTAQTGTYRYMSPENFCGRPYDEKVDIYSMGILIWELLSLEKPFGCSLNIYDYAKYVVQEGVRPDIATDSWSIITRETLELCWSQDPNKRPSARDCEKAIRLEATKRVDHSRRSVTSLPITNINSLTANAA